MTHGRVGASHRCREHGARFQAFSAGQLDLKSRLGRHKLVLGMESPKIAARLMTPTASVGAVGAFANPSRGGSCCLRSAGAGIRSYVKFGEATSPTLRGHPQGRAVCGAHVLVERQGVEALLSAGQNIGYLRNLATTSLRVPCRRI
jgi:hypothetical protein